ncbi:hypothetical protein Vretimale_9121 [Volvox reticuliferus]|uniref:Uncharacterized protein n=1 Tax=Volvox reticuliferus TaxID=1737510 RepID=A0A8J4CIE2_9CHLO|nr:hypothetical protein Vretifemale_9830 [Volvox reticuliferus]GIM04570.1 hypothetical protein Vretimale_9121 [Volvox reticuliferus]
MSGSSLPSCFFNSVSMFIFALILVFLSNQHGAFAVSFGRKLAQTQASLTPKLNIYRQAEAYLDGLFEDYEGAKAKLGASNFKKSNVLVVYMCYERAEVIRSTLTSLLMSQGLEEYDLIISQDGIGVDGTLYILDVEIQETVNALYIHHEINLCTGLHHYFVKKFAFDILGYEFLLVVEEDNGLHHQALQFLKETVELSIEDKEIGLVSIADVDNALLVDESRYNAAVLRVDVDIGHLWVFGMHKTRYDAVSQHLYDYYKTIKGFDYTQTHMYPLCDSIQALHREKDFPKDVPLSQDAFFVHSLMKEGYTKRFLSLVRLFTPMGWIGLHFKQDPAHFYTTYGQGMYDGQIENKPFEIAANAEELENLKKDAVGRLDVIYQQYLGRGVEEPVSDSVLLRLLVGRMNAVELVRDIVNSAEHRRRMKEALSKHGVQG